MKRFTVGTATFGVTLAVLIAAVQSEQTVSLRDFMRVKLSHSQKAAGRLDDRGFRFDRQELAGHEPAQPGIDLERVANDGVSRAKPGFPPNVRQHDRSGAKEKPRWRGACLPRSNDEVHQLPQIRPHFVDWSFIQD